MGHPGQFAKLHDIGDTRSNEHVGPLSVVVAPPYTYEHALVQRYQCASSSPTAPRHPHLQPIIIARVFYLSPPISHLDTMVPASDRESPLGRVEVVTIHKHHIQIWL